MLDGGDVSLAVAMLWALNVSVGVVETLELSVVGATMDAVVPR